MAWLVYSLDLSSSFNMEKGSILGGVNVKKIPKCYTFQIYTSLVKS